MKTLSLIMVLLLPAGSASDHSLCLDRYLSIRPSDISAAVAGMQVYDVTLKWQNLDALNGHLINCNGVTASYILEPEHNRAGWKNVRLTRLESLQQEVTGGICLPAFDSFSYTPMDTAFLSLDMYNSIPEDQRDLARWLVSDAVQMQGLADYIFHSLSYNQ